MKSTHDTFGYSAMIQEALRGVVREVLRRTQDYGMPPEHLFYITFKTMSQQVVLPLYLRRKYPESMTIVLQHQFHNLQVGEKGFSVSLGFSGKFENLCIPFSAIEMFSDPTAELVLSFQEKAAEKSAGKSKENSSDKSAENFAENFRRKTRDSIPTSNSKNNNGSNSNEIKHYSASYSGVEAASNFSSDLNWLNPISYGFEKAHSRQAQSSASKGDHLKQIATKEIRPSAKVLKFRTKTPRLSTDSNGLATKKKITRKTSGEIISPQTKPKTKPQAKKPQVKSSPRKPEDANNDSPNP